MVPTRSGTSSRRSHAGSMDYLHDCLALHGQVTEIRDHRMQDLFRLEDETDDVQSSCRLTYDDIEKIRNSRIWNADAFGYWPSRSEVESSLESTEWDFQTLPENEQQVVEDLLETFRQIELVSVILRFVVPKYYGILSPPVEKVLGIGPFRKHSERYLAYLKDLRTIRVTRNFRTAAEVDMALWVLQVGVLDGDLLRPTLSDAEYESLRSGFRNDSQLREVRVGNLTRQLFSEMSRVELSEALLATDVELAGQLAGIQFEQDVRKLTGARTDDKLADLVRDPVFLRSIRRRIPDLHVGFWQKAVRTRNKAIHLNPPPKKDHVMTLIEGMKALRRAIDGDQIDEVPAVPSDFWESRSIDELAEEQGIDAPQPFDEMIGAAADLWDDEENFEHFVKGSWECRYRMREADG